MYMQDAADALNQSLEGEDKVQRFHDQDEEEWGVRGMDFRGTLYAYAHMVRRERVEQRDKPHQATVMPA